MISLKLDELYCPKSVKEEINPPVHNIFEDLTNTGLFLSTKNVYHLIDYIISLNIKQQTNHNLVQLREQIPRAMKSWAGGNNLNDFEYLYSNPIQTLAFLNQTFLENNGYLFQDKKINNMFRVNGATSVASKASKSGSEMLNKCYAKMTAEEYKNINVWDNQQIFVDNDVKRYKNTITPWEIGLYKRHYDRGNDGLHAPTERASLNNQVHGYDMSNIIKGSTFYEHPDYDDI